MKKYVVYLRVSTTKQGDSGLGLEAQRDTCSRAVESKGGEIVAEFSDVESGTSRTRPGLWRAIDFCKSNDCTLVIAKLDRLARDVEFTFKILNTGIDIYFCDMPVVNTMILGVFASVAQYERELISSRTKAALAAKKERGERWNTVANMDAVSKAARASGDARRERALNNPANVFFWRFIQNWESRNGKITANTDFRPIADELRALGQTTATGLEYTSKRARTMYNTIKRMHENNQ